MHWRTSLAHGTGCIRHKRRCCSQQGPAPCGAGLGADAAGCVAVHGTGTPLGDPIEVGALGHALSREGPHKALAGSAGRPGDDGAPLRLLSVKSCYGHTEGAAGLTGAMLAVQALQQQVHHLARWQACWHGARYACARGTCVC